MILIISIATTVTYYHFNEPKVKIMPGEDFYHFAENETIKGEIWTTNPLVNLYISKKVNLLYYPLYTTEKITTFDEYVGKKPRNIGYIFLDTCGGGMTCSPEDQQCPKKTAEFINNLNEHFNIAYNESFGNCDYSIFQSNKT